MSSSRTDSTTEVLRNATARPWHVRREEGEYAAIYSAPTPGTLHDGDLLCSPEAPNLRVTDDAYARQEANSALIVRAVNAYDQLRRAIALADRIMDRNGVTAQRGLLYTDDERECIRAAAAMLEED